MASEASSIAPPTVVDDAAPQARLGALTVATVVFVLLVPLDGFRHLTGILGFKPVTILGYGLGALALPFLPSVLKGRHRMLPLWTASLVVTTVVTAAVSMSEGSDLPSAIATLWQMLFLAWIVAYACSTPDGLRLVLRVFLLAFTAGMLAFVGLYLREGGVMDADAGRVLTVRGYIAHRAGLHAAWTLLLGLATFSQWSRVMRLFILGVTLPTCAYVVLLTNTRTVHIALIGGLVFFLFFRSRVGLEATPRSRVRSLVLLALVALTAVFVIGRGRTESLVELQFERWSYSGASALTTLRSDLAAAALELARERPLGYGVHASGPLLAHMVNTGHASSDAHNEFLNVLLDGGVLALLFFAWAHGALLRSALQVAHGRGTTWPLVTLISVHLSFLGGSTGSDKVTCVVLGLVIGAIVAHGGAGAQDPGP